MSLDPNLKTYYALCSNCQLEFVYKRPGDDTGVVSYEKIFCIKCDRLIAKPRVGYFVSELLLVRQSLTT